MKVSVIEAAAAPIRGLSQVLAPGQLRRVLLGSLAVSFLAMALVFGFGLWGAIAGADALFAEGFGWWTAFEVALKVVLVLLFLLAAPFLFVAAASIFGGPFLARTHLLARAAAGGAAYPARRTRDDLRAGVHGIGWTLRRLARFLLLSAVLALIGLIPVVGVVALVAEAWLGASMITWELFAEHFEALDLPYPEQRRFLRQQRPLVLAFGGVSLLLLLIPFAQPVVLQACQAGAGALSAKLDKA